MVEYFSRESGRVAIIAKGAKSRKSRGGSGAALLQPFTPLQCSWLGRSELKTLVDCETAGSAQPLAGRALYCGLYLNELLVRLLHHEDPHQVLFDHYAASIARLAVDEDMELVLRQFELCLLDELGYGFDLSVDGASGQPVSEEQQYHYHEEYGMVPAVGADSSTSNHERLPRYLGAQLLDIARGRFDDSARQCAKRLMRQVLALHLGDKPLKSRDLFRRPD